MVDNTIWRPLLPREGAAAHRSRAQGRRRLGRPSAARRQPHPESRPNQRAGAALPGFDCSRGTTAAMNNASMPIGSGATPRWRLGAPAPPSHSTRARGPTVVPVPANQSRFCSQLRKLQIRKYPNHESVAIASKSDKAQTQAGTSAPSRRYSAQYQCQRPNVLAASCCPPAPSAATHLGLLLLFLCCRLAGATPPGCRPVGCHLLLLLLLLSTILQRHPQAGPPAPRSCPLATRRCSRACLLTSHSRCCWAVYRASPGGRCCPVLSWGASHLRLGRALRRWCSRCRPSPAAWSKVAKQVLGRTRRCGWARRWRGGSNSVVCVPPVVGGPTLALLCRGLLLSRAGSASCIATRLLSLQAVGCSRRCRHRCLAGGSRSRCSSCSCSCGLVHGRVTQQHVSEVACPTKGYTLGWDLGCHQWVCSGRCSGGSRCNLRGSWVCYGGSWRRRRCRAGPDACSKAKVQGGQEVRHQSQAEATCKGQAAVEPKPVAPCHSARCCLHGRSLVCHTLCLLRLPRLISSRRRTPGMGCRAGSRRLMVQGSTER